MTDTPTPAGMVDSLMSETAAPTEQELAFARSFLADGDMDPAIMVQFLDPERQAERERQTAQRRAQDWPALGHYRAANRALAGQSVDLVFMGDSITEMWPLAQPDLFGTGVLGRGVSGQTSPQILLRFMPDVVALKPRAVHLMCGVNDVAGNTGPSTPADFQNNVQAMLDLAKANGIAVILASITPFRTLMWAPQVGDVGTRVPDLNVWLAGVAEKRGLVYADYYSALAAEDGTLRSEFTRDGVHPNQRGYTAMLPVVQSALAQLPR